MKTTAIPIYGGRLIVCRSRAEFDRAYEAEMVRAGVELVDGPTLLCSGGMTSHEVVAGELVIVSGVFDRRGSTRAHEATHCAQAVAGSVGMDPIREEEAFAYLVQWFYEELSA